MLKNLRNLIVMSLAASLFFAGCGTGDHQKRVRLPMRNTGGVGGKPETRKGDGQGTGDGTGKIQDRLPGAGEGTGTDGKGERVGTGGTGAEIDLNDATLKDVATRQKTYDDIRNALEDGNSEKITLKTLEAGTYKMTSLVTEFVIAEKNFGVLSVHNVNATTFDGKATKTVYKGTVETGMADKASTRMNIASEFNLVTGDKLEVSSLALLDLDTRVDLTKPQKIESVNVLAKENVDQKGLSNVQFITAADINSEAKVVVEAINSSLGKKAEMYLIRESADLIRMRITIDLGDGAIRNLFVTYSFTKAAEATN